MGGDWKTVKTNCSGKKVKVYFTTIVGMWLSVYYYKNVGYIFFPMSQYSRCSPAYKTWYSWAPISKFKKNHT